MMRRYVGFIVSYPKIVIALVVAITLALGSSVSRVRMLLDIDDQLPPGHPMVVIGKRLEKLFGGKYLTVVGLYPKEGTIYTPEILGKVQRITSELENWPGAKPGSVLSLTSKRLKDIRTTEESIEVKPLADKLPTNAAEVAAFRERVERNRALTSLLVSDDGRATTVIADFEDFEKAGGAKDFYPKLESVLEKERAPNVEIVSAGATSVVYWLLVYVRRVAVLFLVALAAIGYLLYRAFRTLQGMFIPLVTALMGVIWALGLMGLVRAPMDPWNAMTPILILAVAAGHSVQILKRYYEELGRIQAERPELGPLEVNREAVIEATTKMGSVMLAAGTIASLSFASLLAMGVPSIRNFGLCTAFGIAAALTVELTFIPAIRVLLRPPTASQAAREKKREFFDPILEKLARIVREKKEGRLLWVSLVIVLTVSAGVFRLDTRNNLAAQFFEVNGPMHGFRMADAHTAGTRVLQVLVDGGKPDAIKDLKILKRMDALASYVKSLNLPVGKVASVVDVLKVMNRVTNNGNPKSEVLPEDESAPAQFFFLYEMSGDLEDLRRLVDPSFQNAVITMYLKTDDHRVIKRLIASVEAKSRELFAGMPVTVSVGGGVTNMVALNETMVHGKVNNLLQISGLVLLITAIALRSIVGGFLVLLPLATAALVNLGIMGWTGISLTMGTAAISAMAVGIGADYAIYFIFRVREQLGRSSDLREATAYALTTSGKAIAYVATSVAGGYLCLTLSGFKLHVLLGVLVALTMVVCSGATVAFLPAVILRIQPRFLTRGRQRTPPPAASPADQ